MSLCCALYSPKQIGLCTHTLPNWNCISTYLSSSIKKALFELSKGRRSCTVCEERQYRYSLKVSDSRYHLNVLTLIMINHLMWQSFDNRQQDSLCLSHWELVSQSFEPLTKVHWDLNNTVYQRSLWEKGTQDCNFTLIYSFNYQ